MNKILIAVLFSLLFAGGAQAHKASDSFLYWDDTHVQRLKEEYAKLENLYAERLVDDNGGDMQKALEYIREEMANEQTRFKQVEQGFTERYK